MDFTEYTVDQMCAFVTMLIKEKKEQPDNSEKDKEINEAVKELGKKLFNIDTLYVMNTKMFENAFPYVHYNDTVWVFTQESYAKDTEEHYNEYSELTYRKLEGKAVNNFFITMHRFGIKKVAINNGHGLVEIPINAVFFMPQPLANSELYHDMIRYLQAQVFKDENIVKNEMFGYIQKIYSKIPQSLFLVPMLYVDETKAQGEDIVHYTSRGMKLAEKIQPVFFKDDGKNFTLNKDSHKSKQVKYAQINDGQGEVFIPAFTDFKEFGLVFKEGFRICIMTYDELKAIAQSCSGTVINCASLKIRLKAPNFEAIDKVREANKENEQKDVQQPVIHEVEKQDVSKTEPKEDEPVSKTEEKETQETQIKLVTDNTQTEEPKRGILKKMFGKKNK